MHIGVKPGGLWWNEKYYPSVPYVFNLWMDPMEKMDPESDTLSMKKAVEAAMRKMEQPTGGHN